MCYRYSVPGPDAVKKKFKVKIKKPFEKRYHAGAYNHPELPVISNEEPGQVDLYSWGLIPFWVKNQDDAEKIRDKTANARCETIFEKPSFRHLASKKHCLVISNGFFEWRHYKGKNYPYYIYVKNHEPFAIAGLWDKWKNKTNDEEIYSYTIITTDANPMMQIIHNKKKRMPAIIPEKYYDKWLSKNITKKETMNILKPFDENKMNAYTISKIITDKEKNPDVKEVIKPYNYENLDPISKQKKLF